MLHGRSVWGDPGVRSPRFSRHGREGTRGSSDVVAREEGGSDRKDSKSHQLAPSDPHSRGCQDRGACRWSCVRPEIPLQLPRRFRADICSHTRASRSRHRGDRVAAPVGRTRLLGLDVGLFVAAAGFGTTGPFIDSNLDDELAMIDVNCRAVVGLTHGFARRLARRGAGGIVLFGSLVGFQGVPQTANYAATKAFVQSFAEGLRLELKPTGVEVLATAPGPTHSGFAAHASMTMSSAADPDVVARSTLRSLGRRSSTVRPGGLAKLLGFSLIMLPRWARVRLMGTIMSGMTNEPTRPAASRADA